MGIIADNIDALRYSDPRENSYGFKNYIINGNFDVWQRGTTQSTSGYGSDDRWSNQNSGSTKTHSQVACTDTERALFNASYFSRTVVSSVAGASNATLKNQQIEGITKLAGKTVTLSFWAKADANKNIAIEFKQNFGSGGTPSSEVNAIGSQKIALTTTWQKKTITVTLPSIVGKTLGTDGVHTSSTHLQIWFDAGSSYDSRTASLGQQSGTFDIAQVQLEEGSVATPFENRPYGLELSLCQRYYVKLGGLYGYAFTSTEIQGIIAKPNMRVSPTYIMLTSTPIAESPINTAVRNGVGSSIMSVIMSDLYNENCLIRVGGFSGMTAGQNATISNNQIAASAEL